MNNGRLKIMLTFKMIKNKMIFLTVPPAGIQRTSNQRKDCTTAAYPGVPKGVPTREGEVIIHKNKVKTIPSVLE